MDLEKLQKIIEKKNTEKILLKSEYIGLTTEEIRYIIKNTVPNNTTGRAMVSNAIHEWLSAYYEKNGLPDHLIKNGWLFELKQTDD